MLGAGVNRARWALVSTRALNRLGLRALACRGDYSREINGRGDDKDVPVPGLWAASVEVGADLPPLRTSDAVWRPPHA
jgi:hypothetical protein